LRGRNKDKSKQKPTDPDRVWNKEKELSKFHKSKLASQLADFESFREELIPMLRRDVLDGMEPAKMREKYAALIQARQIMTAISSPDESKAQAAGNSVLDRVEGKATEKREVKHTFENLKEEELDAILSSEIEEFNEAQKKFQ
jgi:hypothetical protein